MNFKQPIFIVIFLMTIALIGIIGMQAYWINDSINISEEKFKRDVLESLNDVSNELSIQELNKTADSFMKDSHPHDGACIKEDGTDTDVECSCRNCIKNRITDYMEGFMQRRNSNPKPLLERIDVDYMEALLKKELRTRDISLDFSYGIYSAEKDDFVHAAVGDSKPKKDIITEHLKQSKFSTPLFSQGLADAGTLLLYFPNKSKHLWGSNIVTFIASLIFLTLILVSFYYTVYTILKQKKVSKIKADFVNNMTHEFKTPIATIGLAADSLTNPNVISNKESIRRFAKMIKEENKRMNIQVERVLQVAQLDKEKFELLVNKLDIHDVIKTASNNILLRLEKKEGVLKLELDALDSYIDGDFNHISNIINNLLDNAEKYSPTDPIITIRTKDLGEFLQVEIKDNGIGLTKEDQEKIFEKFYRVHTGNLHDVKGFGLGLSYVKAVAEAHGGSIIVKSELNKGSNFIIKFPRKINTDQHDKNITSRRRPEFR